MDQATNKIIPKVAPKAARGAMAALALSALLGALGTSAANVALPALAETFNATFAGVQWVVLVYLLAVTTVIVGAGQLSDIHGRRRVLTGGIVMFTVASAACAVAPTLPLLIAARAVQGAGAAAMMALTIALARRAAPAGPTGRAIGLLGSMSALGTALGPALGGALIAAAGWRAIFLVLVPAGAAAAIVVNRCLPSDRPQPRVAALDFGGMAALALALGAYAMAATVGDDQSGSRPVFAATAVLAGALFIWIETRARTPIIALAALRDPALTAGLVMNALVASAMMATLVVGPFYLSRGLGLDFAHVGAVMAVGPAIAAFSGVPAGRLTDALGAGRMVIGGLAVMAVGALALAVLPGLAGYIAAMACLTPGYQFFLAANTTAVMGAAGEGRTGTVSGLLNMSRNVGLITGAAVMGAVFARAVGTQDLGAAVPDAVAGGLRITFAVVAGTLAVAAALAVIGHRRRAEA